MALAVSSPFRVRVARETAGLPAWVPPPGHHASVGTNTLADVDPCPARDCSYSAVEGQSAVLNDWIGGTYAADYSALGAACMWGGGHCGYSGNEFYVFDFDTRTWVRATEPSTEVGAGGDGYDALGLYPDGRPAVPHTYDHERYVPASVMGNAKGSYVATSLISVGCRSGFVLRSHFFDLDTRTWSVATNAAPAETHWGSFAMTAYDSMRGRIWSLEIGAPSHVGYLDAATKTWGSVAHSNGAYVAGSTSCVGGYCEPRDVCVFYDQGPLWIWSPASSQLVQATTSGSGPTETVGMEWCSHPRVQRFYCYPYHGTRCWTLTPPADPLSGTWTWGTEDFAPHDGAAAPGQDAWSVGNPRYNGLRWTKFNCFSWVGARSGPVDVFRPADAI